MCIRDRARALALKPEVLLLDEPFSALDPATRQQLYLELEKIHERFQCTIIFVTHDFTEARLLAKRVGILLDGRLKAVASADRLMEMCIRDSCMRAFPGHVISACLHGVSGWTGARPCHWS